MSNPPLSPPSQIRSQDVQASYDTSIENYLGYSSGLPSSKTKEYHIADPSHYMSKSIASAKPTSLSSKRAGQSDQTKTVYSNQSIKNKKIFIQEERKIGETEQSKEKSQDANSDSTKKLKNDTTFKNSFGGGAVRDHPSFSDSNQKLEHYPPAIQSLIFREREGLAGGEKSSNPPTSPTPQLQEKQMVEAMGPFLQQISNEGPSGRQTRRNPEPKDPPSQGLKQLPIDNLTKMTSRQRQEFLRDATIMNADLFTSQEIEGRAGSPFQPLQSTIPSHLRTSEQVRSIVKELPPDALAENSLGDTLMSNYTKNTTQLAQDIPVRVPAFDVSGQATAGNSRFNPNTSKGTDRSLLQSAQGTSFRPRGLMGMSLDQKDLREKLAQPRGTLSPIQSGLSKIKEPFNLVGVRRKISVRDNNNMVGLRQMMRPQVIKQTQLIRQLDRKLDKFKLQSPSTIGGEDSFLHSNSTSTHGRLDWKSVLKRKSNKTPGIDNMTLESVRKQVESNLGLSHSPKEAEVLVSTDRVMRTAFKNQELVRATSNIPKITMLDQQADSILKTARNKVEFTQTSTYGYPQQDRDDTLSMQQYMMDTARLNRSTVVSQSGPRSESISFKMKKELQRLQIQMDMEEIKFNNQQEEINKAGVGKKKRKTLKTGSLSEEELENLVRLVDSPISSTKSHERSPRKSKLQSVEKLRIDGVDAQFNIYLSTMEKVKAILPKNDDLDKLLVRILEGLRSSQSRVKKLVSGLYDEISQIKQRRDEDYNKLSRQFREFKRKNNIDEYFEKYLTDETRKETLSLVKDLMRSEDWLGKLRDYKAYLDKLQYSDTESKLATFYEDLMKESKGRIRVFMEETHQDEKAFKDKTAKHPPLPISLFNAELQKVLGKQYESSIYKTGKKVAQRFLSLYVKPMEESGCQTESIEEITRGYQVKITRLENELQSLQDQHELTSKEQTRLSGQLRQVFEQKQNLRQVLDEVRKEKEEIKAAHDVLEKAKFTNLNRATDAERVSVMYRGMLADTAKFLGDEKNKYKELKKEVEEKDKQLGALREEHQDLEVELLKVKKRFKAQVAKTERLAQKTGSIIQRIKTIDDFEDVFSEEDLDLHDDHHDDGSDVLGLEGNDDLLTDIGEAPPSTKIRSPESMTVRKGGESQSFSAVDGGNMTQSPSKRSSPPMFQIEDQPSQPQKRSKERSRQRQRRKEKTAEVSRHQTRSKLKDKESQKRSKQQSQQSRNIPSQQSRKPNPDESSKQQSQVAAPESIRVPEKDNNQDGASEQDDFPSTVVPPLQPSHQITESNSEIIQSQEGLGTPHNKIDKPIKVHKREATRQATSSNTGNTAAKKGDDQVEGSVSAAKEVSNELGVATARADVTTDQQDTATQDEDLLSSVKPKRDVRTKGVSPLVDTIIPSPRFTKINKSITGPKSDSFDYEAPSHHERVSKGQQYVSQNGRMEPTEENTQTPFAHDQVLQPQLFKMGNNDFTYSNQLMNWKDHDKLREEYLKSAGSTTRSGQGEIFPTMRVVPRVSDSCQTDPEAYILFACRMFFEELKQILNEEIEQSEKAKVAGILKQTEHILNRIRGKAASPTGVTQAQPVALSVTEVRKPQSPPVINLDFSSFEKSWHFDVTSPTSRKKVTSLSPGTNRVKKSVRRRATLGIADTQQMIEEEIIRNRDHLKQLTKKVAARFSQDNDSPTASQHGSMANDP